MSQIMVDRLSLKLSGLSENEGQRLARLIAEELRAISIDSTRHQESIQVSLTTRAGDSMDWLAKQIVASVVRQLQ